MKEIGLLFKVLGSSLFVSTKNPRERNSIIEIWTSTMNSLASLKGDPDFKIQCILQKSYDSLPRDSHRELFLHIARFFVGEYEDDVVRMLGHDWRAKAGIMTLVNRCLLTVSPNKKLMMHQLLHVMGRNKAREESNYPAERSRVSHDDEAYRVFGKGGVRFFLFLSLSLFSILKYPISTSLLSFYLFLRQGSCTIEGLAIDIRKLKEVTEVSQRSEKTWKTKQGICYFFSDNLALYLECFPFFISVFSRILDVIYCILML